MIKTLIILSLLFGSVSIAYAEVFFNDSNIVNIGDEQEPEGLAGGEDDAVIVVPDSNGGSSGSSSSDNSSSSSNTSADTTETNNDPVPQDDSIDSVMVNGGIEGSGDSSNSSEDSVSSSDILNTLIGNQVLSSGTSGTSGGSGGISLSAEAVRNALNARGIQTIVIPQQQESAEISEGENTQTSKKSNHYSRNDVSLIAAALIVNSDHIEDLFFTTDTITLTYAARGRLLFAIPIQYKGTVNVALKETNKQKRVKIKFPWYTFFTWTGVSKNNLRESINGAIDQALRDKTNYDAVAHVLKSISNILLQSQGTIQSSVTN